MSRALAAWLIAGALFGASSLTAGTVLVLPLEARQAPPESHWAGAAVADLLPRDLAFLGVPAIDNDERLRVHELLEIPGVAVARATSIRMGEAVGATRIVVGTFDVRNARLALGLRLLDVERGTLSAPLAAEGPLTDLRALVHSLAWDVALAGSDRPRRTREELMARDHGVSFEVYRAYAQAVRTPDRARRTKLLTAVLRAAPRFDDALLAAGRLQLEAREQAKAVELLARVAPESACGRPARFLLGRAAYEQGRYRDAAQIFGRLATERPGAAVLNNQALALVRASLNEPRPSQVLRAALELAPGAPDLAFNLGFTLLLEGDAEAAAFWLRGMLQKAPADMHARVVLCWALRRAGHAEQAEQEWRAVLASAPSYETLLTPDTGRRFERLMPGETLLAPDARSGAELAATHASRAERLLEAGDAPAAVAELTRAIVLDAYAARAHRLLARAHQRLGANDAALAELRMALWCREDSAVRVELAQVLASLGRKSEARTEALAALKVDPDNVEAQALLRP